MENIRAAANWRSAILGLELLVAAGCFLAGWRLVKDHPVAPVQVHRAAPTAGQETSSPVPIPMASPEAGATRPSGRVGPVPDNDLLRRLSRDDFSLYKTQWQVIQLLVDGTRQFLEQRVLPALMAAT